MKNRILNIYLNNKFVLNCVLGFFVFQSLFVSLRLLIIGSGASNNWFDFLISSLPEVFALFVFFIALLNGRDQIDLKNFSLLDKIIVGFIVSNILLGVILAGNLKLSMYAIRMSYFPMIFYFVARFGKGFNKELVEKYIHKIIVWYVFVAGIGLFMYFFLPDFVRFMTLKTVAVEAEYYIKRMGSLFWTPVVFASFVSVSVLYFYYKLLHKENIWHYLVFGLLWCCLFLSVSRGAFIATMIGCLVLSVIYKKYVVFLKSFAFLLLAVVILGIFEPKIYNVVLFIADSTKDTVMVKSGLSRVELWKAAYQDFLNKPMGYGLGKAGHVAARFYGKFSHEAAVSSTDGWYLKIANETGVWGLLSYCTLVIVFIAQSIRYLKKNFNTFYTYFFIVFLMVGIQNIVSNVNDFYSFSCLYWLFIGISQNIYLSWRNEKC